MVSEGFDRDADDAEGRETTFAMDPQTVIWGLARQLVQGQSDLAQFRRAADAARRVRDSAPEASPTAQLLKTAGTRRHYRC